MVPLPRPTPSLSKLEDSPAKQVFEYRKKKVELSDLEIMASDQEIDLDIKKLANDELKNTKSMLKELEKDIQLLLLPKDEADEKNAILEVQNVY